MSNNEITVLTIRELLSSGTKYVIPIYQRNYAWGSDEISQLIQDVIDYASSDKKNKDYYIGTLVVSRGNNDGAFETIDGQQRLTTLSILTASIRNKYPEINCGFFVDLNLSYESREKSTRSLQNVYEYNLSANDMEVNILSAYNICIKHLSEQLKEHAITIEQFTNYLYDFVKVLRVPLPNDIDLNHYFEIMNSRGEQLEKHEILKAQLMAVFNECEQDDIPLLELCFDIIWQSCSNMESYVQYGFSVKQRNEIFQGETWDILTISNFDELVEKLRGKFEKENNGALKTIDEILNESPLKSESLSAADYPDKFNSVINFQNFLLHVLRVQHVGIKEDIKLDDKRLLDIFDPFIKVERISKLEFVKDFIFNLLKTKLLFDKYIIKREFTGNSNRWSLKSLRKQEDSNTSSARYVPTFTDADGDYFDSDNRRILMLLSMFHVSNPSMSYKYWLYAALQYLYEQFEVNSSNYIAYLEHIARAFVFDRFLMNESLAAKKEYNNMIQDNRHPVYRDLNTLDVQKTYFNNIENNLVFNFLDYLLWLKYKRENLDSRIKSFEFSFRSSVEHYYPQTPIDKDLNKLSNDIVHLFGNLCLISNDKNSRLSNLKPASKKEYYPLTSPIDSLKQYFMMSMDQWGSDEIRSHGEAMISLLRENMHSNYSPL